MGNTALFAFNNQTVYQLEESGRSFTKDGIYILFSALAKAYNTEIDRKAVFPVRLFAGLPLLIFTLMLMESYLDTNAGVFGLIGFLILGLYLSKWTQQPIENLLISKIKSGRLNMPDIFFIWFL